MTPCRCSEAALHWVGREHPAPDIVMHLSDRHGGKGQTQRGDYWPTARIADWLESLGL